ncbi:hypothetical protein Goshw_013393 [Gossypium schwendimanii]|uniref:Uncharacterized protein n=1 Tax=Gossypium schwendimanii TaxID=34291 RepID=A0A7J9M3N8_GOSSC|nr:hypothetical protein [Gossypium schwendimanii]
MVKDEISLLEEELVQLSVKSSLVILIGNQSLVFVRWNMIKKDLMHAIGSTFRGVIRSKIKGEFCWLKTQIDA